MMSVKDIFEFLDRLFPISTACDFDNAGLLIGDKNASVSKVLTTLDFDLSALNKAKELGCELVVTHHPVIFNAIKRVTAEDLVYQAAKSGISVISMHTNLDIAAGGVNDCLCSALNIKNVSAFTAGDGFILREGTVDISDPDLLAADFKRRLGCAIRYVAGRPVQKVIVCSGSGGDFLADAIERGTDALITGEAKHNIFEDAINAGISLFELGHYSSEQVVIPQLAQLIEANFGELKVFIHSSPHIRSI